MGMARAVTSLVFLSLVLSAGLWAQQGDAKKNPPANNPPPRSDSPAPPGWSSSRDTTIDLSPPKNDRKDHPDSGNAVEEAAGDVQEFHPYDPHRADKNVEVGDFYFKRKNYRAAEDRYREALLYKPNDAVATFRLAVCLERAGEVDEAGENYEAYVKILPNGPFAEEANQALKRLKQNPDEPAKEKAPAKVPRA